MTRFSLSDLVVNPYITHIGMCCPYKGFKPFCLKRGIDIMPSVVPSEVWKIACFGLK